MGFQVSPGVNVSEIDLTAIVPSVSTTAVGFVGVFSWGPLDEIVLLGNENNLVQTFGKPNDDTATSFFTAANVLAYGDKLRVVRVANTKLETFEIEIKTYDVDLKKIQKTDGLAEFRKGDTVILGAEQQVIAQVIDSTHAILENEFVADLSVATTVQIEKYVGSENARDGSTVLADTDALIIKNDVDYEQNYANGAADVEYFDSTATLQHSTFCAKFAGALGNSLRVSICPSANAFKQDVDNVDSSGDQLTATDLGLKAEVGSLVIVKDGTLAGEERSVVELIDDDNIRIDSAFSNTVNLDGNKIVLKWEYADQIGVPPTTSEFAADRNSTKDELHIVVVDRGGQFSGVKGAILEKHSFLSKAADAKKYDGSAIYYPLFLFRNSRYIRFLDHPVDGALTYGQNAIDAVDFEAADKPTSLDFVGGRDVNTGEAIPGAKNTGFSLFSDASQTDVSFLVGGDSDEEVAIPLISLCENRKDCLAVLSPPRDAVVDNFGNEVDDTITFRNKLPSSSYAILDSGWKYQYDKYNDVYRWVPLCGDIAGLCVRTDLERDPWWSPAGFTRGQIKNVIKLAYSPFKAQRDDLYLSGINPVINEMGQGTILYGDKTLLERPSAFDRINVRRLFIVLEKSIARAAKTFLFEFNDAFTRAQFRNLVEPYLRDVQGRRGIYDFRVVCDSTNNTPEVIDRNEFVGDIYIKPARSINFIQLNFIAVRTGVEFEEIVGKF